MLVRRVWPSRPSYENPFADFDRLRRQMLRFFDTFDRESFGEFNTATFPPMNVTQDENNYYVRAEVPGISPKDLEISAQGRTLSIAGKRRIPSENNNASYHRKERAEGEFSRALTLPTEVDVTNVDAQYKHGIVTVTLPKSEAAKPRKVVVRS